MVIFNVQKNSDNNLNYKQRKHCKHNHAYTCIGYTSEDISIDICSFTFKIINVTKDMTIFLNAI